MKTAFVLYFVDGEYDTQIYFEGVHPSLEEAIQKGKKYFNKCCPDSEFKGRVMAFTSIKKDLWQIQDPDGGWDSVFITKVKFYEEK